MKATDEQIWDKQYEGYDSNDEYTGANNNYRLLLDNGGDTETWTEILEALYRFKVDSANKMSVKGRYYLNQMINKNIRNVKKRIDLIIEQPKSTSRIANW